MIDQVLVIGAAKTIVMFLIILTMLLASITDLKYTRINTKTVIILFALVPIYLILANANMVIASFTFLFSLAAFMGLWLISKGGFGLGDVLVLSALGWLMADFELLQAFLITMAVFSVPWALFWIWKYRRDPYKASLWKGITKKVLPIDKIKPGMVLAKDKFMKGLTEKEIDQMKIQGFDSVSVKQPMPFIPVVFAVTFVYAVAPWLLLTF